MKGLARPEMEASKCVVSPSYLAALTVIVLVILSHMPSGGLHPYHHNRLISSSSSSSSLPGGYGTLAELKRRFEQCLMFVHEAHQAIKVPKAVKSHCYAWMVQAMNGDKPQGGSGQLPPGIDDDDNQIRQHWANLQGTSRITAMETFIKTVENMTTTYGLHSALAEETEADCYACNSAKYKSDFSDYRPDWLPEFHELHLLRKEKERLKRETHFLKLSSKMATTNKQQDDELVDSLEEEEEDAEEAKRLHHQQQEEHRLPNEPVDLRVAAIKLEGGRGHHGYNGGDHTIDWSRNDDNDENEK